ncbi:hypothetical protein MMIC_P1865 [Mariprofundus micogutta]|uniref:Uncharacterized protein n=1 Tax=Mariprofundus micogutta TaxID=1921010 RepID=A0A1L8CPP1_9PROT|nr:hypothetical protein [Mariprofundus micogutta]GAV20890.1 hypothetical protein MMIC_P1865 [Mariprofundus micogutta]
MKPRITIDRLWFEFAKDKFYGEKFSGVARRSQMATEGVLESIGFNKTVNQHPKLTPHQRPILTPLKSV